MDASHAGLLLLRRREICPYNVKSIAPVADRGGERPQAGRLVEPAVLAALVEAVAEVQMHLLARAEARGEVGHVRVERRVTAARRPRSAEKAGTSLVPT